MDYLYSICFQCDILSVVIQLIIRNPMAQAHTSLHSPYSTSVHPSTIVASHLQTAHIGIRSGWWALAKALVPSVMLLPAGRGRAEEKQNRTSSDLSGEQPLSSSVALRGKRSKGSTVSLLLSPLLCPRPALLSLGCVLLSNTPPFLCEYESNAD